MASTEPIVERPRARLRRLLLTALLVLAPAVWVRTCVVGTYAIQSSSMEPTLLPGDQLVVVRDGLDPRALRRWDLLVLDDAVDAEVPEQFAAVAKRLAGLPGEVIELRSGDLLAGPGLEALAVQRKDDALAARLLVPVQRTAGLGPPWTGDAEGLSDGGARLRAAGSAPALAFAGPVLDGTLSEPGAELVADTALQVVVGEGDGVLHLRLAEGADRFGARLAPPPRGGASLHHNLGGGEVASDPHFLGLRAGSEVLFWNVDDGLRLFVDGRLVLAHDYPGNAPQPPGTPLNNMPAVGVEGGELSFREVTVLRDLHHGDRGTHGVAGSPSGRAAYTVPPGHVFLLGDLDHRSRDSRHFGAVPLERLVGRPVAIYRPWSRARWLHRAGGEP